MFKYFNLLTCCMSLTFLTDVQSDYFTSVTSLEDLLGLEFYWLDNFENYVEAVEESNDLLRKYLESIDNYFFEIIDEPKRIYEDPLNGLRAIKRMVSDWKLRERLILNPRESEGYANNLTAILTELQIALPTHEDLTGAAKGLARLQTTYDLKTTDIANGELLNTKYSPPMTTKDCYYMGRYLYDAKVNDLAVQWLEEATARNNKSCSAEGTETLFEVEDVAIFEFLGPAYFSMENFKMAAKINEELLHQLPDNPYGLANKIIFESKLLEERELKLQADFSLPIMDTKLKIKPLYEGVCRGAIKQTPAEQRNLRCRYVSNGIPFCILARLKKEELSFDPIVALYHDSIYDGEIKQIIDVAEENVERSKVGDITVSTFSDVRTSQNTWLWYETNSFLNAVHQRLRDITGLSLESAEPLQVATYGIGGHYGPHHDFSEVPDAYGDKGNRLATALFYISNVQLGGGTAFPHLRLLVPPVRGSLLLWFNLHESYEMDYRTLHAGCPVLKGSKWVCNEWFHEGKQELIRPCSLNQHGNKSIEYKGIHYLS